jgi:hypothetical protein
MLEFILITLGVAYILVLHIVVMLLYNGAKAEERERERLEAAYNRKCMEVLKLKKKYNEAE